MDTQGFTPDVINLITDNLRDRYANGFPILKELIQNADDAKARRFAFGQHLGFRGQTDHPLLQCPGLWFFNDGDFEPGDKAALRAFGSNSKAGDPATIGKFGLGMKSVFHLCEAFFYLAWDGTECHAEVLNPWKTADGNLHPEWDGRPESDWDGLAALAEEIAGGASPKGFLLWVPLRRRDQLRRPDGTETWPIIDRFPGDDPTRDLAFLRDAGLAGDLAEVLPLLQHLEVIEHRHPENLFTLSLSGGPRVLGPDGDGRVAGRVTGADGSPMLRFCGRPGVPPGDWAHRIKGTEGWPKSRYRGAQGQEETRPDKAEARGAVLFCSGAMARQASTLHWAVFLPLEEGGETLSLAGADTAHALVLHGEFFVDAGRRKVYDQTGLHEPTEDPEGTALDEAGLRRTWNRRLAQEVLAPAVIPALADYVTALDLPDPECAALTRALEKSGWFGRFRANACASDAWVRRLVEGAPPAWTRVTGGDRDRLRPFPTLRRLPGDQAPRPLERLPWDVFPGLKGLDILAFDADAPSLTGRPYQWTEDELLKLLAVLTWPFSNRPAMEYLEAFLQHPLAAAPYRTTEALQTRLVALFRRGLGDAGAEGRRHQAERSRRLMGFVEPKRRRALAAELPDALLGRLWGVDAPLLLVPKGLDATQAGEAVPDNRTLAEWLGILDQGLTAAGDGDAQKPILDTVQGLLKTLDPTRRGDFLRDHKGLRVIATRDARSGRQQALSFAEVETLREARTLFGFAQGTQDAQRLGLTPLLAKALPEAGIALVHAPLYRELFGTEERLPAADSGPACLIAVGRDPSGQLGTVAERRALLERADDPGTEADALRGLRYLLHGSADRRTDVATVLWIGAHGQHPAWGNLWRQLHDADAWSLVPDDLANTLPRVRWDTARVREIDARNLILDLRRPTQGIPRPADLSREEREEILSQIEHEDLWRRLPLHTCLDDKPVTALGDLVYLAPESGAPDDPLFARATLIRRAREPRLREQQGRWLRPLDDRARIELALADETPEAHWRTILDALGRLADAQDPDLCARLRTTAWLPTRDGGAVKPDDVIDLPPGLANEAQRLVGEHRAAKGPVYATPADLGPDLVQHSAWAQGGQPLCSGGIAGLGRLGLLLSELPDYAIGRWTVAPDAATLSLLAACDALPGWRLLAKAQADGKPFDGAAAWSALSDGLDKDPRPERLRAALDWLSQDTNNWRTRKAAFDRYLGWHKSLAELDQVSPDLRLASLNGQWQVAAQLCAGAHGIDPKHVLDPAQASILGGAIRRADSGQAEADGMPTPVTRAEFDAALVDMPQILASYFKAWEGGWVAEPLIGLFLGLLGVRVRPLAEGYLQSRPFDLLMDEIPWQDLGGDPMRRTWMDGLSREHLTAKIQLAVRVLEGDCIEVPSLLGDWISVPIDREVGSLLVGGIHWTGGYRAFIRLRRIDPAAFDESRLGELLRGAAETLHAGLYNQPIVDLGGLCQDLSESDQVEIRVARRLILEHVPFYLRQLTIDRESLRQALTCIDECRRRIAELDAKRRDTQQERRRQSQAMEDLADLIERDAETGAEVLDGVKTKLAQYQYKPASIPFELFQNADDAAVELGQIEAHPAEGCEVPDGARRLVVEQDAECLRFLHWGRAINARGPAGFDGEGRGFGRDLEKMLVLSASDKQPGQGVTGKFGLGFKSVLLACDRPRILSGRLALEVVAGILPQPWQDSAGAREALARHAPAGERLPGTLIELPGLAPAKRQQILERFVPLAGVLCVFARALRHIRVCAGAEGQDQEFAWEPRALGHGVEPSVEVGRLRLADDDWGADTQALCIRTADSALLLTLGPSGFRPLPKDSPSLWVTAPLRETDGLGLACTAPFDLDAGRARLAGDSQRNLAVAQTLGLAAGAALGSLFERGRTDWPCLCRDLGLDPGLNRHDLWRGLWTCLTDRWLGRRSDAVAALGRGLVLALLKRLSARDAAVPNGLTGPFQALIDLGDARYQLPKGLATPEAVAILDAWTRFKAKYPPGTSSPRAKGRSSRRGTWRSPSPLACKPWWL